MKLSQQQIIVRYLAARKGEWIVSHALEKANLDGYWIGTRGTRTARDLATAGKFTDTDGTTHFIERRHEGKYAEFRVTSSQAKPRYVYEFDPERGVMVEKLIASQQTI